MKERGMRTKIELLRKERENQMERLSQFMMWGSLVVLAAVAATGLLYGAWWVKWQAPLSDAARLTVLEERADALEHRFNMHLHQH